MPLAAEQRKADLVNVVAEEIARRVSPDAGEFARGYFSRVPPDDVAYTAPEILLGQVKSMWVFGEKRLPGEALVRVFNPSRDDGWSSDHTIVEVVNDDMPFLVDSIVAELDRTSRSVHLVVHPIIKVSRDGNGLRTGLGGEITESYIHVEFDQETDPGELRNLTNRFLQILGDVRVAVDDWPLIRNRMAEIEAELGSPQAPTGTSPADTVEETRAFLQWLISNHFVFLGYRRYDFVTEEKRDFLHPVPPSGLGILRRMRPESTERGAVALGDDTSRFARGPELLLVTKTNARSNVHRNVAMDRVSIKRFRPDGTLVCEERFIGLFTSTAYSSSVRAIPVVRRKVAETMERSGLPPGSHDGKALMQILETLPRDEMLQMTENELFEISMGILQLQERRRVGLFLRRDVFGRFISALLYVPRDLYDFEYREKARAILERAFGGISSEVYSQLTDSPLARAHFIVRTTPGAIPDFDPKVLEAELAETARTWSDHLLDAMADSVGEERGIDLHKRYRNAFPSAYMERFTAAAAIRDVETVERVLATRGLAIDLYRESDEPQRFRCKITYVGMPPLSELMPRLENMGVRVNSVIPFRIEPVGAGEIVRMRDFSLETQQGESFRAIKEKFEETFLRVWSGDAENDGFNRLVLASGLEWNQVVILRAYCKYLRQTGIAFSESYMQQTLAGNPKIARLLVDLFRSLFDPSLDPVQRDGGSITEEIEDELQSVRNLDEDRILRRYLNVILSTLRTNYFQKNQAGKSKPYLSFKLDSQTVEDLPLPRPMFEIFVYSPRVEGVHLRGGEVARGGIRWSDRREDFRMEILGLMKAQMVKNAVIVPVGAKGGFVVKQPPVSGTREDMQNEGIECYKTLVRGLLDLTDNLVEGKIVPPGDVVRRDEDDPYLVVAADKGTATFSDIANSVSAEYGFWLGDAFASGGSAGYDHKKMGITARGGWEAVKRHFRELGTDVQSEDFTAIGVGDMAGDVFGNGMLLSPHLKLIAAFNHAHIFVDPDPDPGRTFAERERLFNLPRSSWADYDTSLLSAGGAIFDRSTKSITVSDEVFERLDLPRKTLAPHELIQGILRARADLLWLGGIGTYVKASDESHLAARDRANDMLRVNGSELRVRVVAEGANLGFTQRGRVEFALREKGTGKINTDAIDNSAGVDCSDHEVNIKIAVDEAVRRGALSPEQRLELLVTMTEDVGQLVLMDNYLQTQAISVAHSQGEALLDAHARFMRTLERAGKLDRSLESLPDDEMIAERHAMHLGLMRPELAVVMAYSKISLYSDLLASDVPDDPLLHSDLLRYFPAALQEKFRTFVEGHRLRRQIIATSLANEIVNRSGITFVAQVAEESGRGAAEIARAYIVARDAFDLRPMWEALREADGTVPASLLLLRHAEIGSLLERATLWLLRNNFDSRRVAQQVSELRPRIASLAERADEILPATTLAGVLDRTRTNLQSGFSEALARRLARLEVLGSALDVIRLARFHAVEDVARIYFGIGERFGFDRLRAAARAVPTDTPWQKSAVAAVIDDLFNSQTLLASKVAESRTSLDTWIEGKRVMVTRIDQMLTDLGGASQLDLAMLTVASRQLRMLAEG